MLDFLRHTPAPDRTGSDWKIILLLVVLTLGTRLPFQSELLFEGDSVNFALGMEQYDVSQYRPHPPGYFFYIGIANGFNALTHDANAALVAASILFSVGTIVFLFLLARDMFSRRVGLVASLLFLFVPFFWFYGEVALSYSAGACFGTIIAYLSYKILTEEKKKGWIYLAFSILGLSGGIRQDILMYLFPMVFLATILHWQGLRTLLLSIVLLIIAMSLWYIPMVVMSQGYAAYSKVTSDQFVYHASEFSVIFGNSVWQHFKMVKDLSLALIGAMFFATIYGASYFVFFRKTLSRHFRDVRLWFLLLWILPALVFFTIVFIQQMGYVLVFLPAVYILFAVSLNSITERLVTLQKRTRAIWVQVGCISLVHILIFLSPPILATGEAKLKPFEEKTWEEVVRTSISKMIYRHTYFTTRSSTRATNAFTQAIRELPYSPDEVAVVVFHRSGWSFSHALYYLPEYRSFYVQDYKETIDKIRSGRYRKFSEYLLDNIITLPRTVRCLVIVAQDGSPSYRMLEEQISLRKISIDGNHYMFVAEEVPFAAHIKNLIITTTGETGH